MNPWTRIKARHYVPKDRPHSGLVILAVGNVGWQVWDHGQYVGIRRTLAEAKLLAERRSTSA